MATKTIKFSELRGMDGTPNENCSFLTPLQQKLPFRFSNFSFHFTFHLQLVYRPVYKIIYLIMTTKKRQEIKENRKKE